MLDEHRDVIQDLTKRKEAFRDELHNAKRSLVEAEEIHHKHIQAQVTEKTALYKEVVELKEKLEVKAEEQLEFIKARTLESGEQMGKIAALSVELKRAQKLQAASTATVEKAKELQNALAKAEKRTLLLSRELERTKRLLSSERQIFEGKLSAQLRKKSELNAKAEKLMQDLHTEERRRASALKAHALKSGELIGELEATKIKLKKLERIPIPKCKNDEFERSEELKTLTEDGSTRKVAKREGTQLAAENDERDSLERETKVLENRADALRKEIVRLSEKKSALESAAKDTRVVSGNGGTKSDELGQVTREAQKLRKEHTTAVAKCTELKEKLAVAEGKVSAMFRKQQKLQCVEEKFKEIEEQDKMRKKEMKQFKAGKEAKIKELVQKSKQLEQRLKEALSVNEFQAARLKKSYTYSAGAATSALILLLLACILGIYYKANA